MFFTRRKDIRSYRATATTGLGAAGDSRAALGASVVHDVCR